MIRNDRGLTLVEVLAALVILGIVFIGLMTVFPQMTLFNAKTENKLETMNLARQELSNWQDKIYSLDDFKGVSNDDDSIISFTGKMPNAEVDFYVTPDLKRNGHEKSISLHKIHINIKEDDKIISETFGYVQVR